MNQQTLMDKFHRFQVGALKIHNRTFPIYEGVNTIGRNKEAIVNIKHLNVSQSHAVLVIINDNHFISDLNSSNGTFLENRKIEPFKLFELKHNITIKLGDLCGTYISQGPFSNNNQSHFEMTQDLTQSFYGSNTQILDNTKTNNTNNETEDIHDAATQEISLTSFKIPKNVKPIEKNMSQTTIQNNSDKIVLNKESEEEDIHNCETQVICDTPTTNETVKGFLQSNSSEDIHNAPTQILPLLSNKSGDTNNPVMEDPESFGPFNDEVLPFLENNDNYVEIPEIPKVDKILDIHETVTQVMDISTKNNLPVANLEDEEATDCEDNADIPLSNIKKNPEDQRPNTQDEVTDCEDNTQNDQVKPSLGQKNKNNFLESDEDTNDSVEFFKVERSFNKDQKEDINKSNIRNSSGSDVSLEFGKEKDIDISKPTYDISNLNEHTEKCSEESIHFKKKRVCRFSSDSDSDDEKIGFRRKNKSAMVISTQDICEKEVDTKSLKLDSSLKKDSGNRKVSSRDSYLITDTDSETEVETGKKNYLEDSVAPTQNQSTADLNDTDCIPATQDAIPIKSIVKSPINNSENANGSSEESFKLGLTELMIPSQTTGNSGTSQDPCCSKTLQNFPIDRVSDLRNNIVIDEIQSDDTDKTDIYILPTQKINQGEIENDSKIKETDNQYVSDIFLAPTQKITDLKIPSGTGKQSLTNLNKTENIYEMATQKIDLIETKNMRERKGQLDDTNNDIYFAPTQKIDVRKTKDEEDRKGQLDDTNNDIYFALTQKIDVRKTKDEVDRKGQLDDTNNDIYFAPTQKMDVREAKDEEDRKKQLDDTNSDIYFAATQKVYYKVDEEQNSSRDESMDDLYLQPTQELENTFNRPTQKFDKTNLEIKCHSGDESQFTKPSSGIEKFENARVQSKKKFSFKKAGSSLDGSLTSILNPSSESTQPQLSVQREDSSSIELEIVENNDKFAETSKRPSNPLSHVLDNFCQPNDTIKSKEKVCETLITEISAGKKIYSDDADNQEAQKNINNKESGNIKDGHDLITTSPNNNASKEEQIISKDQVAADSDLPTLKTSRSSRQSSKSKKSENKTHSDLSQLKSENANIEKVENKNKLEVKSRSRRITRRPSFTSLSTKTSDLEVKKFQDDTDLTDNSLNTTSSSVNQSIALLESKLIKTRKTMKSSEIQVKVPKNRKSMTISEIEKVEGPEKIVKENISTVNITTKKRGRPKRGQPDESDTKDNKSLKESKNIRTISNNPKSIKEKETNASNNNLEETSSTSKGKVSVSAYSSTRQAGKRKQPAEVKSDRSDTSNQSVDLTTPKKQKLQPSRPVGKRKQPSEVKSDNSDSSIQSADSNFTTPKKQKLQPSEALLSTKERGLRKQKPKVVFTMLESPQMESMIKQLGGSVIDSVDSCTVLLTESVKRSQKLLSAVGLGKPICSPKWVMDSKKSQEFLDPWDYILTDPEAEKKWNFSLKESLNRSKDHKLLNSYNFQIQVTNAADVLKGAIESCGGKCISKIPSKPLENTFIISTQENQSKYRRIIKQHSSIKVIEPEAIFDGVLRQELRFSKHYLT